MWGSKFLDLSFTKTKKKKKIMSCIIWKCWYVESSIINQHCCMVVLRRLCCCILARSFTVWYIFIIYTSAFYFTFLLKHFTEGVAEILHILNLHLYICQLVFVLLDSWNVLFLSFFFCEMLISNCLWMKSVSNLIHWVRVWTRFFLLEE